MKNTSTGQSLDKAKQPGDKPDKKGNSRAPAVGNVQTKAESRSQGDSPSAKSRSERSPKQENL